MIAEDTQNVLFYANFVYKPKCKVIKLLNVNVILTYPINEINEIHKCETRPHLVQIQMQTQRR